MAFKGDYQRGRVTTDEQLAYDRDRAAKIRFALEKYAAEHNAESIDWTNPSRAKYCIYYDTIIEEFDTSWTYKFKDDNIYFDSAETAQNAIEAVGKEDVLWLYRDYQPYLDAFKK